jgi:hypothetical protein
VARRSEAIHTHADFYAQFARNQTNVIRRAEAIHVENHALSQIGSRGLEARVAALEQALAARMTPLEETLAQVLAQVENLLHRLNIF